LAQSGHIWASLERPDYQRRHIEICWLAQTLPLIDKEKYSFVRHGF